MFRSTSKATASITLKQQIVAPTLQSCKTQKFGSNFLVDGGNQIACLPNLKLHSITVFNTRKTLPREMDEF